jgi:hypothetical protein
MAVDIVSKLLGDGSKCMNMVKGVVWVDQLAALEGSELFAPGVVGVPLAEPVLSTLAQDVEVVLASHDGYMPNGGDTDHRTSHRKAAVEQFKPDLQSRRIVLLHLVLVLPSIGESLGNDHFGVIDLAQDLLGHFEFVHTDNLSWLAVCSARLELLGDDDEVEVGSDVMTLSWDRGPHGHRGAGHTAVIVGANSWCRFGLGIRGSRMEPGGEQVSDGELTADK